MELKKVIQGTLFATSRVRRMCARTVRTARTHGTARTSSVADCRIVPQNAITNELYLMTASRLYQITGNASYLALAQREWAWFNASGMINDQFLINDGLTSSCKNNNGTTWTCAWCVCLGALLDNGVGGVTALCCARACCMVWFASCPSSDNQGVILGGLVHLWQVGDSTCMGDSTPRTLCAETPCTERPHGFCLFQPHHTHAVC